jgi:hypothetical protein
LPEEAPPREFFSADPEFASTFAVFLRQYPQHWRIRRIDRFSPRDLNLADHKVSLQGRIDRALVEHFLTDGGRDLDLRSDELRAGQEMTIYLPVTRQPKRLLLEYSIVDADERPLPMLNRYEDAGVEALNLLSLARLSGADLDDDEAFQLLLVLSTIVFINPQALETRVARWAKGRPQGPVPFAPGHSLQGEDLADWIEGQGDFFRAGLGKELRSYLEPVLPKLLAASPRIAPTSRRGELDNFGSIPSLVLHGIRDFLKLMYEAAPEWHSETQEQARSQDESSVRATSATTPSAPNAEADTVLLRSELLQDAHLDKLAEDAVHNLLSGLVLLEKHFSDRTTSAASALIQALDSWWAYVQLDVKLGVPFIVKSTELMPLGTPRLAWHEKYPLNLPVLSWITRKVENGFRGFLHTAQFYPVNLKDAQSVHIEIAVPHPELSLPKVERSQRKRLVPYVERATNSADTIRASVRTRQRRLIGSRGYVRATTTSKTTASHIHRGIRSASKAIDRTDEIASEWVATSLKQAMHWRSRAREVPLAEDPADASTEAADPASSDLPDLARAVPAIYAATQSAINAPRTLIVAPQKLNLATRLSRPRGLRVIAPVPSTVAAEHGFSESEIVPPFGDVFGGLNEPSDRLLHAYSSRQLHEGQESDWLNPFLFLYVPLKFRFMIFFGFASLVAAYLLVAAFVVFDLAAGMLQHQTPTQFDSVVLVGALAVTLSFWMTSASNSEPIVNQKLVAARWLLISSVAAIISAFTVFGVYVVLHDKRTTSHHAKPRAAATHATSKTRGTVRPYSP